MEHRAANTHTQTHRTIQGNREAPETLAQLEKRSLEHLARIERLDDRLNCFVDQMLAMQGRELKALRAENSMLRAQASDPAADTAGSK